MSDNIFTSGESFAQQDRQSLLEAYLKRSQDARNSYSFENKSIIDIDELPTATTVKAVPKPIDNVIHPNPDNKVWSAYVNDEFNDLITPDAIDYFKNNPTVTSVDFNVSYPGYTDYDYHPIRYSDPTKGFTSQYTEFGKRDPVFAGSLKQRIKRVNEVIDANPDRFNPSGFIDNDARYYPASFGDSGVSQNAVTKRINFTPEDSRNLSRSLNDDLTEMFRQAPEGTTFVNNPDTPSRGKLYSRSANFSDVDFAGNQFVTKGKRGSLVPLQITDSTRPTVGKSNFDPDPTFGRTLREFINPDSVPEIRDLPKFQRSLYQKPKPADVLRKATQAIDIPITSKGLTVPIKAVGGEVALDAGVQFLSGESPEKSIYGALTNLIPQGGPVANTELPLVIGGREYQKTNEPSRVIGPDGKAYGLQYLNKQPQVVPYGEGAAGGKPIYSPITDLVGAIGNETENRIRGIMPAPDKDDQYLRNEGSFILNSLWNGKVPYISR